MKGSGTGTNVGTSTPTAPTSKGFDPFGAISGFFNGIFGAAPTPTKGAAQQQQTPGLDLGGLGGIWNVLSAGLIRLVDGGIGILDQQFLGEEEKYEIDQSNALERDRINAETERMRLAAQAQRDLVLGGAFVLVAGGIVFAIAKGAGNGK